MRRAPSQASLAVALFFEVEPASPGADVGGVVEASFLVAPSVESVDDVSAPVLARAPLELDRSFLAQPEPLKSTAGAANDLRSWPSAPHAGQNLGAGASMPWMNSVTCRQWRRT